MKKIFLVVLVLNAHSTLRAQSVAINTDGSAPHPSAILDIKSSTKGILIPRTSTATRQAMVNLANGLMVYDTTIGSFWFQNGGVWIEEGRLDVVNTNAFFGYQSGKAIPTGDFNSGFGAEALFSNTTGLGNTSVGTSSMHTNTVGNYNTAAGMFSLYLNTTGTANTAIGNNAMFFNQTGFSNVAIGAGALFHNVIGQNVVAIGDSALFNSDNSQTNTAVGSKALYSAIAGGSKNTAVGSGALSSVTTGSENTAVGLLALHSSGAASSGNVAIGYASLEISPGSGNVGVGSGTSADGSFGTAIGAGAFIVGNIQYSTALGANAHVTCSNCIGLGGDNTFSRTKVGINNATPVTDLHIIQQTDATFDNSRGIRLQRPNGNQWRVFLDPGSNYVFQYNNNLFSYIEPVGGSFISNSDERLKRDILSLGNILDKTLQLHPKTYYYRTSETNGRRSYGFLAQDVEKLFPEFVFSSENGIKGIAYTNFSVIAIKAIQEQQTIIETLLKKNEELEKRIIALEN
jgi:hypothetical protein